VVVNVEVLEVASETTAGVAAESVGSFNSLPYYLYILETLNKVHNKKTASVEYRASLLPMYQQGY